MIIDMSHSAERSTLEAIDLSSRPTGISHANPSFAHDALRNKSNTVIKALTERGGLIGFSLYPFHLPNGSQCSLEDFCQMVAKTAELFGVEHPVLAAIFALTNHNKCWSGCAMGAGLKRWIMAKVPQAIRVGQMRCRGLVAERDGEHLQRINSSWIQ